MDCCSPLLLFLRHLPSNISIGLEFKKVVASENWKLQVHRQEYFRIVLLPWYVCLAGFITGAHRWVGGKKGRLEVNFSINNLTVGEYWPLSILVLVLSHVPPSTEYTSVWSFACAKFLNLGELVLSCLFTVLSLVAVDITGAGHLVDVPF